MLSHYLLMELMDEPADTTQTTTEPLNKPTDLKAINDDVVVEEPETPKTTRILTIDKVRCNKELKDLVEQQALQAIPINKVKEILKSANVSLVDTEYRFVGRSGNADLKLVSSKGIPISNSALIVYWNRIDTSTFELNIYLS